MANHPMDSNRPLQYRPRANRPMDTNRPMANRPLHIPPYGCKPSSTVPPYDSKPCYLKSALFVIPKGALCLATFLALITLHTFPGPTSQTIGKAGGGPGTFWHVTDVDMDVVSRWRNVVLTHDYVIAHPSWSLYRPLAKTRRLLRAIT